MSISAVSSSSAMIELERISAAKSSATTVAQTTAPASVGISKMGDDMSELSALSTSDPDKFKKVMADIADKLKAASQDGSPGSAFLSKLADKFSAAAQSGDMSSFKASPQAQGGVHGHGHHSHHAHAYAQQQAQAPAGVDDVSQIIESALQSS